VDPIWRAALTYAAYFTAIGASWAYLPVALAARPSGRPGQAAEPGGPRRGPQIPVGPALDDQSLFVPEEVQR
jgi:hypothetical protein